MVFGLALGVVGVAGAASSGDDWAPESGPTVVICHATNPETNPYNQIEVSQSAVDDRGHANHTGPVWYPGAKAAEVRWGDVIPPIDGVTLGLNWPEGESTFVIEGCELFITDADADTDTDGPKVVICHATNSEKNPYNKIEVSQSAVEGNGHGNHTGPVWYPGAKDAGVRWGDIIPPIDGVTSGLNWSAGQSTYNNGCDLPGVDGDVDDKGNDKGNGKVTTTTEATTTTPPESTTTVEETTTTTG